MNQEQFFKFYSTELSHLRENARYFLKNRSSESESLELLPDGRSGDPHVERLMEGFAYLASRVQHKLQADFPIFTEGLLESLYPDLLRPIPSTGIVQFEPELDPGLLENEFILERGMKLLAPVDRKANEKTPCQFRTAMAFRLLPLKVEEVKYLTTDLGQLQLPETSLRDKPAAAICVTVKSGAGDSLENLSLPSLPFFLSGSQLLPFSIYDQLMSNLSTIVVGFPEGTHPNWAELASKGDALRPVGFEPQCGLFAADAMGTDSLRLLREYFILPEKFLFFSLDEIPAPASETPDALRIVFLLREESEEMMTAAKSKQSFNQTFKFNCAPVINLFDKILDRVRLDPKERELQLIADRHAPADYEISRVTKVSAYDSAGVSEEVHPIYSPSRRTDTPRYFYSLSRRDALIGYKGRDLERREPGAQGDSNAYFGKDLYIQVSDAKNIHEREGDSESELPYPAHWKELRVFAECTNRTLPIRHEWSLKKDFLMETGAPVKSIRFLGPPSLPREAPVDAVSPWKLINQLRFNYQSLTDDDPREGAAILKEALANITNDPSHKRRIDSIVGVKRKMVVRRILVDGRSAFVRGMEVNVEIADSEDLGKGSVLLGGILERLFGGFVSVNSFTETVLRLRSVEGKEIKRWTPRSGAKQIL